MKRNFAGIASFCFAVSVILWLLLTVFEAALPGMSAGSERMLLFLLLVLPAATGAILGLLSMIRKEGRTRLAVASIVLNGLIAMFHAAILLFAG